MPANQNDLRGNSEYTPGQCPANDVVILAALLDTGDPCNSCTPGETVTADLIVTIQHGTNSDERYLGIFADIEETLVDGTTQTCDFIRCQGDLAQQNQTNGNTGIQTLNYGEITFICGSSLTLTDILLVWTAANGECPVTPQNNPNGKYCYDNGEINIAPPLNAVIDASCGMGNTADIDLVVTGGSGDFSYSWDNGDMTEDLSNVPLGTYMVTVTDNNLTDANGDACQTTASVTFNGPCCSLEVTCPTTGLDLGSYNCSNIGNLPDCPTTLAEATSAPYNIGVGMSPCGTIGVLCSDNIAPDVCSTTTQNIVRTITIFDDTGDGIGGPPNGELDMGEESFSCDFTYTITSTTALSVDCPDAVNLGACSTMTQITTAYNSWRDGFKVNGGCNATSNIDLLPDLPTLLCGNPINLNFTLAASDDCRTESCSSSFSVTACPPPTADAGSDQVVCGIQAINLNATTNGTGSWSGGAGSFGNVNSASTTYTPNASELGMSVTLTWTTNDPDGDGPCMSMSDMMIVTFSTPAEAEAGSDQVVCGLQDINLNATTNGTGSWSGGSGSFDNVNSTNATYTPDASESGMSVTLTWTTDDPDGAGPCEAVSDMMMVMFNAPAEAEAGSDQVVCGLQNINLTATTNGTGSWSGGAGSFGNVNNAGTSYIPNASELGMSVTLTWTTNDPDGGGPCTSVSDMMTVIFNPPAEAEAGSNQVVCGLQDINLAATTNGTGSWSGGAGFFSNVNNTGATYTPNASELGMSVTLTWTTNDPDGGGPCTSVSDMMTVTFNTPAEAEAGSDQVVCGLQNISLAATTNGTGSWSGGAGSFSNVNNTGAIYTPNASELGMSVTLTWTTNDPDGGGPCISVSDMMTVVFNIPAEAEAGNDQVVCGLQVINLAATTNGTGSWSGGSGSFGNVNSASTTYTPNASELGSNVTLTWTTNDPDGAGPCTSVSDMMMVTFNTPAEAEAGSDQVVCGLQAISLAANTNGTGSWSGGSGSFNNVNNTGATYTPNASELGMSVTLTWTTNDPDGGGPCTSVSDMMMVTFNTPAEAEAGSDQVVCGLQVISLAATTNGTGSWSGGAGSFNNVNSASTTYTPNASELGSNVTLTWTTNDPDGAGPCTSVSDMMMVTFNMPAEADAGGDVISCGLMNIDVTATTQMGGTGIWIIISGNGGLMNATSLNTAYVPSPADEGQTITLEWTTNDPDGAGPCEAVSDQMTIMFNQDAMADAGDDQIVCGLDNVAIMATGGMGTWNILSGSGSINSPTSLSTLYIPNGADLNNTVELEWVTADPDGAGPCQEVSDAMEITFNEPATASTMDDVTLCGINGAFAISVTANGNGSWNILNGNGTLDNANNTNTNYNPVAADVGTTVQLEWTTADPDGDGPCIAVSDILEISFNVPATANAGDNQIFCGLSNVDIDASASSGNGIWSVTNGNGNVLSPTSAMTTYIPDVNDLGNVITLEWTTADPDGADPCVEVSDEMTITFNTPAEADAGADQIICGITNVALDATGSNGSGMWSIVTGDGSLSNANSPTATYQVVASDEGQTITLEWMTNDPDGTGPCTVVTDLVNIIFNDEPVADAGADQTICGAMNASIDASNSSGSGVWNIISGNGTIVANTNTITDYIPDASDIGTTVTLEWTTADPDNTGPCVEVSDQMTLTFNTPAEADAGTDQIICGVADVVLDATGSNGSGIWSIISGDGNLSNASSPTATYQAVASDEGQTVALQWLTYDPDGDGPCNFIRDLVNITFNSEPEADAGADQIICGAMNATIDASNSSGGGVWNIVSGNGTIVANTNVTTEYIPNASDVGTTVTLEWTTSDPDGNGPCIAVSDQMTLTFNTPAEADAGTDQIICGFADVTLDATGSNGSGMWSIVTGDGSLLNASSATATYQAVASDEGQTITLEWTTADPDGAEGPCEAVMDVVNLIFNGEPEADAGADQTICGAMNATIDASNSSGDGVWNIVSGNGTIVANTNATTDYIPATSDVGTTVTLEWTTSDPDGDGPCTAVSDQMTLTFNTPAQADAGADQVICGFADVALDATGSNGSGIWTIIDGDGSLSNVNSPTATYQALASDEGQTIILQWTTNDPDGAGPCEAVTDVVNITFNGQPFASAGADQTVCGTTTVMLDASNSSSDNGLWNIINGNGTIITPNSATTSYIPNMGDVGTTVTLQWTTSDPDGDGPCTAVSDLVDLTFDVPVTVEGGENQTVCSDAPAVTLEGVITGGTTTGTWTGGNGTFVPNATTLNATYTPTTDEIAEGSVTLLLTSDDPTGPCIAAFDSVIITINPNVMVNAGVDQEICSDAPIVILEASIGGGATSGLWTGGDGSFLPNAADPNATYIPTTNEILAGTVNLTFTTNDPNGPCGALADMIVITILSAAEVDAGANQVVCAGEVANLMATLDGGVTSGMWSGGNGIFDDATNSSTIYTPDISEYGSTITLTWMSDDPVGPCMSESDSLMLTINNVAMANAGVDQMVCEGEVVQLMAVSSGAAVGGTWSGGNGTFDDVTNPNANYTPATNEMNSTIELIWTSDDPDGPCTAASDTVLIMIGDAANANAGSDQTLCEGDMVFLEAIVGGGAMGGTWSGGNGTFSDVNDVKAIYTPTPSEVNTTITLTWTTDDPPGPCTASSDEVLITINEAATVNAGDDQEVCGAIPVMLNAALGGSAMSGTWSGGAGFFDDVNSINATYTPAPFEAGSTVTLTWTSDDPDGPCPSVFDEVEIMFNSIPTAVASATLPNVCELDGIDLMVNTNGTGSWSVVNGTGTFTPSTTSTNVNYMPAMGEANVTLQFVWTTDDPDGAGPCISVTDTVEVFVNELPLVDISAIGDTICAPDPDSLELFPGIALEAILGGSATSGTWSGGLGTINFPNSPTQATYIPDASEFGNSVTLYWTSNDPDGVGPCEAAVDSIEVFLEQTKIVGEIIVTNSSNCGLNGDDCDGSITFTLLSGPVPGFYEVRFIFGSTDTTAMVAGNAGPPAVVSLNNLCTGGYFIVSVTPPNGCTDIINKFVTIEDPNAPLPPVPDGTTGICLGQSIELFANIDLPPGGAYFWQGPNGFVSFEENPVIENPTIDNIGIYTLTIIVGGCSSEPGIVEVNLLNAPSIFPATLQRCETEIGSGIASFDLNDVNEEILGQMNVTGNVMYYASEADALSGNNPLPNNYNGPSTQLYVAVINEDGCLATATLDITVTPNSDLGSVAIDRVCDGNHLYVIDSENPPNPLPNNDDLVYYWYLDGELVAVIEGIPYYPPTAPGIYTVEVVNLDPNICSSLSSALFPYTVEEIIDCRDCGK